MLPGRPLSNTTEAREVRAVRAERATTHLLNTQFTNHHTRRATATKYAPADTEAREAREVTTDLATADMEAREEREEVYRAKLSANLFMPLNATLAPCATEATAATTLLVLEAKEAKEEREDTEGTEVPTDLSTVDTEEREEKEERDPREDHHATLAPCATEETAAISLATDLLTQHLKKTATKYAILSVEREVREVSTDLATADTEEREAREEKEEV